jgi:hypothetical protein
MASSVVVTGKFPPPIDGQSIATRRLASLLASARDVHRIDLSSGHSGRTESKALFRPAKIWHYLKTAPKLHRQFSRKPDATVLWTSTSPTPLAHLRDLRSVIPAIDSSQSTYGGLPPGNVEG